MASLPGLNPVISAWIWASVQIKTALPRVGMLRSSVRRRSMRSSFSGNWIASLSHSLIAVECVITSRCCYWLIAIGRQCAFPWIN